jgi:hypothetical protein
MGLLDDAVQSAQPNTQQAQTPQAGPTSQAGGSLLDQAVQQETPKTTPVIASQATVDPSATKVTSDTSLIDRVWGVVSDKTQNLAGRAVEASGVGGALSAINEYGIQPYEQSMAYVGKKSGEFAESAMTLKINADQAIQDFARNGAYAKFRKPLTVKEAEAKFPVTMGLTGAVAETAGSTLADPRNWPLMAGKFARPILNQLMSGAFAGQMGKSSWEEMKDTAANWDTMSPYERWHRMGQAGLGTAMTAMAASHAVGGEPAKVAPKSERGTVAGERTTLRPTTVKTAGVEAPIPAAAQEAPSLLTRAAATVATPGEATEFQKEFTKPAARRQAISTLSQVATDKIAAHDALVNGEAAPQSISGTQVAGKHMTPDEIWPDMQKSSGQTWDKARETSVREQGVWQQERTQAEQAHREGVDHYNELADAHNADPANADNPIPRQVFNPDDVDVREKPATFDELKAAVDSAKERTGYNNPTDVRQKARDIEVPKAEKALDSWFKDHEEEVSPAEYASAKSLWADSERFKEIANNLRGKLAKGNLSGNDIRGLEAVIDGKAITRRGAAGLGEFKRLLGPEAVTNLSNVAKLFDPLEPTNPLAGTIKSWGMFGVKQIMAGALGYEFGLGAAIAGEGVGYAFTKLVNHILFNPEFGSAFRGLMEATKTALANGTKVSGDVLSHFKGLMGNLWKGEEGSLKIPGTGGGLSPEQSQVAAHKANGGSTFDMQGNDLNGKDKYSVGSYPERTETHPAMDEETLRNFKEKNADLLNKPDHAVGTWQDGENHVLDVTKLYGDRAEAVKAGTEANQKSIYHLGSGELIDTGGTGEVIPQTVGTKEAAASDTSLFNQAKAENPGGSISDWAKRAQDLKDGAAPKDMSSSEITTRRPKAVGSDLSNKPDQHANMDAIEQAGRNNPSRQTALGKGVLGYKEKLARTVAAYTGVDYSPEELKNPDKVLSKFVNHVAGNIEWLYNQVPDEIRGRTRQWYDSAHKVVLAKSAEYGYTPEQGAGVVAALSPQNPWDNNLGLANRMMDIYRNRQAFPYSPEMESMAAELKKVPTQSKAFKGLLRDIAGKSLGEVKNADPDVQAMQRALWVRLYDEAHGTSINDQYAPTGEVVGHSGYTRNWIGLDQAGKAVKILEDGSVSNINDVMGQGHKIRNFYNNIINPNSKAGHVTIDTHSTAAGLLQPLGAKDTETSHTFGGSTKGTPGAPKDASTGLQGTYPLYAEAYQKVARKLGILPRELQSVTWEAVKSLMGEEKKTSELKSQVKEIWQDAQDGKLTADEAREKIKSAAQGFSKPEWMSDEEWEKLGPETGDTSFDVTQHQMASIGSGEHTISADVNPPSLTPEVMKWKGQPEPKLHRDEYGRLDLSGLDDIAAYDNANVTPEEMLSSTAHETGHAFLQHHLGVSTDEMSIGLGHRAVRRGRLVEGLAKSPIDGVSGGFVSPGNGWKALIDNAETPEVRKQVIKNFVTQLMAGRAIEELLGHGFFEVMSHASSDISMAKGSMKAVGIPSFMHDSLLDEATETAKDVIRQNFDTIHHIAAQMVNHYGGKPIDGATFHEYRKGGVYKK